MGYYQAGFEVTGVDHIDQPHYPFRFIQADALEYLRDHGHEYDVIHASPPCHLFTKLNRANKLDYPNLIPATRELLAASGKIYVIENVEDAPLKRPVLLCGLMFPPLRVIPTTGNSILGRTLSALSGEATRR
jgi:DNA (cytosine-5)-methyltransferase 1